MCTILKLYDMAARLLMEASKTIDYLIEENRRKTFKKWVFRDKDICNADKMAEAGFIFTGNKAEPDSVKCFFCNKPLDGWDPTDCPWAEHLKHASKCSFAKLQKPEDCLTLDQFLDIKKELLKNIITFYCDKKAEHITQKFDKYEDEILSRLEKIK